MYKLILGKCEDELKKFPDNSIGALVTDPPAGISFMGKKWDSDKGGAGKWIEWLTNIMREVYRVLKPGAHGLVWALPKIAHRTTTACELAGFEIRDVVHHLFCTGFPKSLDISKNLDKKAKVKRKVVGVSHNGCHNTPASRHKQEGFASCRESVFEITAPATDTAKQWEGWGTALKPCIEHWILIRKPLSEKTVVDNVLKWGVGGINIDGCRVPTKEIISANYGNTNDRFTMGKWKGEKTDVNTKGRWPTQLIHDGSASVINEFAKYGESKSTKSNQGIVKMKTNVKNGNRPYSDKGTIARFFYCCKASTKERELGLNAFPLIDADNIDTQRGKVTAHNICPKHHITNCECGWKAAPRRNTHPTVKALALMEYLITMITPKGETVLDIFAGSGSTIVAAVKLGFDAIGITDEKEHFDIMQARVKYFEDEK